MTERDVLRLKQLGLKRYIDGMTIQYILPQVDQITPHLSKSARQRLKWMDYHRHCQNISKTCRYFGIARKTFYAWHKRYNPQNLLSLEEASRRPKKLRQWQVTREEENRVKILRKQYIRYGKEKLKEFIKESIINPFLPGKFSGSLKSISFTTLRLKTTADRLKEREISPKRGLPS